MSIKVPALRFPQTRWCSPKSLLLSDNTPSVPSVLFFILFLYLFHYLWQAAQRKRIAVFTAENSKSTKLRFKLYSVTSNGLWSQSKQLK